MPFLSARGLRFYYREQGAGDEPILFIHGNLASGRWWEPVISRLPSERYRMVALDLRGCGRSDKPETGYTVPELTEDVRAFVTAMGLGSFHLVGHSMGGAIALLYALDHQTTVRSVTVIAPVPPDGLTLPDELYPLMEEMRGDRVRLREGFLEFLPGLATDDFLEMLVDDAFNCHPACYRELPRSFATLQFAERLATLRLPTLIVWGERDRLIPRTAMERLREAIPSSRWEILQGIGHGPQVEAPDRLVALLSEFLASLGGK